MHFDKSLESNASSVLEDGEIQKLLTSSLCVQEASVKPIAMAIQEQEVSAQTSQSSRGQDAAGKPVALFSPTHN